ncbi:MAG: hypothetical protein ACK5NT_06365 [Pyrinomonadaceae bacterium]
MKKQLLIAFLTAAFATVCLAEDVIPISAVQGDGYYSPYANKTVVIEGVVTGKQKKGFYIQSPDDKADDNPKTSEGIYIFTKSLPDKEIVPGVLVQVKGKVDEYRGRREVYSLFLTEIADPKIKIISADNAIPTAAKLTSANFDPNGQIDQLERFEGMLVEIDEMTAVAPTTGFFIEKESRTISDGVFYAVMPGTPRPFREAGLELLQVIIDKLPQDRPVFDMNPEMLRIDSNGLEGGRTVDVTSGATVRALHGVIDYSSRGYTLLCDERPIVSNLRTFLPAGVATPGQITVASMNLENFFDDEDNSNAKGEETILSHEYFQKRLRKVSLAVREVLNYPDVIGTIEMENIETLTKLADFLNADAVKNGVPNPKYVPYLKEGNDFRGIDVGYLVKSTKLEVLKLEQIGADEKLKVANAFPDEMLFDRPPLLLQVREITEDKNNAFQFTILLNHFKSYRDIEQSRVQNKRRLQAEYVAKYVFDREKTDPLEKLILIGDFNSFQFPDGYNDLIGTLLGKPSKDVMTPAQNVYDTGLVDLVFYIAEPTRYSFSFGGNAQLLDHVLINKQMIPFAKSFGYARVNADFPLVYENDDTRPERYSDHDVPILFIETKGTKPEKPVDETKQP